MTHRKSSCFTCGSCTVLMKAISCSFCLPTSSAEPQFSITYHIRCLGKHNETQVLKRLLSYVTSTFLFLISQEVYLCELKDMSLSLNRERLRLNQHQWPQAKNNTENTGKETLHTSVLKIELNTLVLVVVVVVHKLHLS